MTIPQFRPAAEPRWVVGHGGLRLAVYQHGDPGASTVVLIHGYPDNHSVWDLVVQRLSADHHVVTYDVRGAGRSDVPREKAGYRLEALVADLVAVVDVVSPTGPVHLAAHDWGSIQAWSAVVGQRARERADGTRRFASFTSMSGPGLEHVANWTAARRRPGEGNWSQLARQGAKSWYIYAFHTPLPAVAWRRGLAKRWPEILRKQEPVVVDERWPGPHLADDAVHGIGLYRANMVRTATRPGPVSTDVPVQLVVALDDPFVSTSLLDGLEQVAPDLRRREVPGGHWLPRSRADDVACWIAEHVADVDAGS